MSRWLLVFACVASPLTSKGLMAQGYEFTTISFPGAAETVAYGMNNAGTVVGEYGSIDFTQQFIEGNKGFIFKDGEYESIEYPGAVATSMQGINDSGVAIGDFVESDGTIGGFIYEDGEFTRIGESLSDIVAPADINNSGHIVGTFSDGLDFLGSDLPIFKGFFFDGDSFDAIEFPSGGFLPLPTTTFMLGINDDDDSVGIGRLLLSLSPDDQQGGFRFPGFDPVEIQGVFVFTYGINNLGDVAGAVGLAASDSKDETQRRFQGYVQSADGTTSFVTLPGDSECFFDVENTNDPTVPDRCLSFIRDVNDDQSIVGYFDNDDGVFQAFIGTLGGKPTIEDPVVTEPEPCDVNGSGACDAADIDAMTIAIITSSLTGTADVAFDISGDGVVDVKDRDELLTLLGTLPGDTNLDGSVLFEDFLVLSAGFGSNGGWADGNFTIDGEISFPDFLALSANFGTTPGVTAVPEPAQLTWLIVPMFFVIRRARAGA